LLSRYQTALLLGMYHFPSALFKGLCEDVRAGTQ
jgi:hypothetical protein